MTDEALWHFLCLYHVAHCGPALMRRLLAALGSAQAVLAASAQQLQHLGCDPATALAISQATNADGASAQSAGRSLEWLRQQPDHHLLCIDDPDFPAQLKTIPCPPLLLFARGQRDLLQQPMIAVVGSRAASHYGREQARLLATDLARKGLLVCSGLALGIDAAAHLAALDAGLPTVAVLGSGIERIYPAAHHELAQRVRRQGVLLSEFPLQAPPLASHFPRRNRIISGLSLGVVVVEAGLKSGSLITARQALEQNREVFALPGAVSRNLSRGCHQLLREGACLIESANDVLEVLAPLPSLDSSSDLAVTVPPVLPPELQQVLDCVDEDPLPLDVLMARCGLTFGELSRQLLQLELRGRIAQTAGGYFRC